MSKINELILALCPNGVEYKNIKDLCLENFWVMPSTPNYQNEGIPYITSKNIRNGIVMFDDVKYITEEDYKTISNNRPITENDFLISMIGTIGEVGVVKEEDLPFYGQNMYLLRLNTDLINIKYFYHYFTSEMVRKKLLGEKNNGNQGYLKTKNIESLKVPVPPLEVQNEIVRILDKFGELEAKLEAELEARKSQYEFWRGKLLNKEYGNKKNIYEVTIWDKKFNSVEKNMQPSTIKYPVLLASDLFLLDKPNGNVFLLSTGEQTGWTTEELAGENLCEGEVVTIPWGKSRPVSEVMKYYNGKFVTGDNRIATSNDKDLLLNKYLYYWFQNNGNEIDTFYRGAGIQHPNMKKILTMTIDIPPLEIQKNIVNILDKFESLVNDITLGLPAEIELRRKQYEYYRNKLLSFEELSVSE